MNENNRNCIDPDTESNRHKELIKVLKSTNSCLRWIATWTLCVALGTCSTANRVQDIFNSIQITP